MHSWLASGDQEKQVSASDRHISNGKFAALSVVVGAAAVNGTPVVVGAAGVNGTPVEDSAFISSFDLPWLTVAQEARNRAPATSKEIEVNTGRLVGNEVHS